MWVPSYKLLTRIQARNLSSLESYSKVPAKKRKRTCVGEYGRVCGKIDTGNESGAMSDEKKLSPVSQDNSRSQQSCPETSLDRPIEQSGSRQKTTPFWPSKKNVSI